MISFKSLRVFKEMVSATSLQLVNLIIGFIIPQLFLTKYGSTTYGLISSTQQLLTYFNLLEAGISSASIQALYSPLNQRKWESVNGILSAARQYLERSGLLFLLLAFGCSVVYPLIIRDNIQYTTVLLLVLIMGSSGAAELSFSTKYRVILTADRKLYVFNLSYILAIVISSILRVILMVRGYNIVVVQSMSLLAIVIKTVLIHCITMRMYPNISFNSSPDTDSMKQKNAVMIHQIGGLVVYNSPTLLLTIFTNLSQVSIYSVYNFLFSSLYSLLSNIFSTATTSSFGKLHVENNIQRMRDYYIIYEFVSYFLITCIFTVLSRMVIPFVKLYTEGVSDLTYENNRIAILFLIVGILNNIRLPLITMVNAAGHFENTKNKTLFEVTINILVSITLIRSYGLYGILLGSVASFLYRTTDLVFYVNKYILFQSARRTIVRIIINLVFIFLFAMVLDKVDLVISGWAQWLFYSICQTIIIGICLFLVYLIIEPSPIKSIIFYLNRNDLNDHKVYSDLK